jgi:hypothetical protein
MRPAWHVPTAELTAYTAQILDPPQLWSVEAHLLSCADCRGRLTAQVAQTVPDLVDDGWTRLDATLDAPRPAFVERLLVGIGVGEATARLLVATPSLRRSWLLALGVTLALLAGTAVLAGRDSSATSGLLLLVPLLPVAGVALCFGPRVDPLYEVALVAPVNTLRLMLIRAVAVLTTTTVLSAAACLAVPDLGLRALGWVVPALALTVLSLTLTPRFGPVAASVGVGVGWALLVLAASVQADGSVVAGGRLVLGPVGQLLAAAACALAALALIKLRPAFDLYVAGGRRAGTGRTP